MILLKDIKKYLEDNNLLIYDNRFRSMLKIKKYISMDIII